MATTFPRYGRNLPCDNLIVRPQIQEMFLRNGKDRLGAFLLKPVGCDSLPLLRGTDTTFYLPGAKAVATVRSRSDLNVIGFSTDASGS